MSPEQQVGALFAIITGGIMLYFHLVNRYHHPWPYTCKGHSDIADKYDCKVCSQVPLETVGRRALFWFRDNPASRKLDRWNEGRNFHDPKKNPFCDCWPKKQERFLDDYRNGRVEARGISDAFERSVEPYILTANNNRGYSAGVPQGSRERALVGLPPRRERAIRNSLCTEQTDEAGTTTIWCPPAGGLLQEDSGGSPYQVVRLRGEKAGEGESGAAHYQVVETEEYYRMRDLEVGE